MAPGRASAAVAIPQQRRCRSRSAGRPRSTRAPGRRSGPTARPESAFDLRTGDDVVAAVGPADPGLVAAVVVGRPQHQRGLVAPHGALLGALVVEAPPEPDEPVAVPLLG